MIRNAMWRRVELVARDDLDGLMALERAAADRTDPPGEVVMTRSRWDEAIEAYYQSTTGWTSTRTRAGRRCSRSDRIRTGPAALAGPADPDDPEGHHDWVIDAVVDLDASDEAGELVLARPRR